MAVTHYTPEFINELREQFIIKFNTDSGGFATKLKLIQMPKGTYSSLLNDAHPPKKKTLEMMRAYLENRVPKWTLVKAGEFYCYSCEEIYPVEKRKNEWVCKACSHEVNSKVKTKKREKYILLKRQWYARTVMVPGKYRMEVLYKKKAHYLKKNYGKLAACVELIEQIRKQMK